MRLLLASGARLGSPFETAWPIAACAAVSYMTDAETTWAKLRAAESEWRQAYTRGLGPDARSPAG